MIYEPSTKNNGSNGGRRKTAGYFILGGMRRQF